MSEEKNGIGGRPPSTLNETMSPAELTVEQTRLRISALVEEVAALREAAREKMRSRSWFCNYATRMKTWS